MSESPSMLIEIQQPTDQQTQNWRTFIDLLAANVTLRREYESLSDAGRRAVQQGVFVTSRVMDWKMKELILAQHRNDPNVQQRKAQELAELKQESQRTAGLSVTQRVQEEKDQETFEQKIDKANALVLKEKALAGQDVSKVGLLMHTLPYADVLAGPRYLFRAVALEYSPDKVSVDGLKPKPWHRQELSVFETLSVLFCDIPKGAAEYLALYRGSSEANMDKKLPFVSTGPFIGDAQGGSAGYWQYAVARTELPEISPADLALQLQPKHVVLPEKNADVRVFANDANLRRATLAMVKHGPLGEETWLATIPARLVVAFTRLGVGQPWARRWTRIQDAGIYLKYAALER